MFDALSDRFDAIFTRLRGRGRLGEAEVDEVLREIRLALLEADVNFRVVKELIARIREQCLGADLSKSLSPAQQVIKIVHEELVTTLGGETLRITYASRPPTVVLLAGLQGSGKTTAAGKLARWFKQQGRQPLLVGADLQRPAAVEQLEKLGAQAKAHVYSQPGETDAVKVAAWARKQAARDNRDALIVDTAGRLHVDQELMDELARVRGVTKPHDVLLVVDAMTGQDAVNVAESFAEAADFDGVLITKLDGDARGGAALSVRAVTGKPIIYASTGEKLEEMERFHPDRMAGRILGMGDVVSLIEKTQDEFDEDQAADLERKIRKQQFTLDDFLGQMKQVRRMGPLGNLMRMVPGMGKAMQGMGQVDERELDRIEAIILSMTPYERAHPAEINGSRRKRIATGSGTTVQAVNRLVKQFGQMNKLMKQMSEGKMPDPQQLMRGMR
jgi:signal recognition particle subunit SRP54